VDVVLDQLPDERRRFVIAREVSALGPPAPAFAVAKARLQTPGVAIVERVSRRFAARVVEVVKASGGVVTLRPYLPPAAPRRFGGRILALAALALFIAAGGWFLLRSRPEQVSPAPSVQVPVAVAPSRDASSALETQDVGKLALPAVVSITCNAGQGAGFFIDAETVLTNAHVACPLKETQQILLQDGRRLLGTTQFRDEWLDFARVRVAGAAANALAVGDATALVAGDPVVFVGSPIGLAFTLHEGKVSFVGRDYLGVGYVQINASINPGNSGGPLLNKRGEVVGIVSMKLSKADGIGFALPIEYAIAPGPGEEATRWKALLAAVDEQDRREVEKTTAEYRKPELVGVKPMDRVGLVAFILERWSEPPHGEVLQLTLTTPAGTCALRAPVERWLAVEPGLENAKGDRHLAWILKRGLAKESYVAAGKLDASACAPSVLASGGTLTLKDGAEERGRVQIGPQELSAIHSAMTNQAAVAQVVEARDKVDRAGEEASWRGRFRTAREKVAAYERRLQQAKNEVERFDCEKARDALSRAEHEAAQVREELQDLERSAANNAVPLEWRR
jgi:serine protease Do